MTIETSMRKLFAFLGWLFSFFRWLGSAASHPPNGKTAEHLLSQDEQQESKLAAFLSSLPEDGRQCRRLEFYGDSKVIIYFGVVGLTLIHGTGMEAGFGEFLEAVASLEVVFRNEVDMGLTGDNSCKYVVAFADALRKSSNKFEKLHLICLGGSPISFTKCISSALLGNDAIQYVDLHLLPSSEVVMDKEFIAEFMDNIAMPHSLRILKSFAISVAKLDGEGMEQLMKPFQGPPSVLEELSLDDLTSDAQLEHISGMVASSTSLKFLFVSEEFTRVKKSFLRGLKSLAHALGSNPLKPYLVKVFVAWS